MKTRLLLIISCIAFGKISLAQYECLTLESQRDNTIQFNYAIPASATIIDTILPQEYGVSQTFSFVEMDNDDFGLIDSVGFPMLPQLSFEVNVPINAVDIQVSVQIVDMRPRGLSNPFLPAQADIVKDSLATISFRMDTSFYNSNSPYPGPFASIVDEYNVFGEKGITVMFCPFVYAPNTGLLMALRQANITISYNLDNSGSNLLTRRYTDDSEIYLEAFFANYTGMTPRSSTHNYVIIAPPQFKNIIPYFANYKRNLGYNVTLALTSQIGSTPSAIKSYLQGRYDNASTRPDYVLLVGDTDFIPQYAGTSDPESDPVTDLGYSLLDGNDLKADVFLGRFPVSSAQELKNIINKTIFMEMNLRNMNKKATFIAGDDDSFFSYYFTNEFEKPHNYIISHTFVPNLFLCTPLYQPTLDQVTNNLSNNPLFFIYSGHGNEQYWALKTFKLRKTNLQEAANTIFPFTFAFACLTGKYSVSDNIGNSFIKLKDKGAVTYFGSSVSTYTIADNIIEKSIFNSTFSSSPPISALINQGMNRYRLHITGWFFKRYLKSYNLLGDPSLHINGTGCLDNLTFIRSENIDDGCYTEYRVTNNITNNMSVSINNGAEVHLYAGNEIYLTNGFYAATGSLFTAEIAPCGNPTRGEQHIGKNEEETETSSEIFSEKQQAKMSRIVLYPNPTTGLVNINLDNNENSIRQVKVRNLLGATVLETANMQTCTIDVSSLPTGIYLVSIVTSNGKQGFAKLIKQ